MENKKNSNSNLLATIGNSLIVLSIVGLLITFSPIIIEEIRFRFVKDYAKQIQSTSFNIQIPKIKINLQVIKNVDPWNKNKYLEVLQKGVAHAQGSALPDQEGTVFLFAHSSDVPWRITRYNTAFYRLRNLNTGDAINITYKNQVYHYKVTEKKIIWPSEISYLTSQNQDNNQLILQTCTPIGTSLKRLLIIAKK